MCEEIIESVKYLAHKKGESPTASMKASGVGKDFFVDIRKGKKPSIEKIEKLANYFNVSTDYLLGKTDDPDPPGEKHLPDYLTVPEGKAVISINLYGGGKKTAIVPAEKLYAIEAMLKALDDD